VKIYIKVTTPKKQPADLIVSAIEGKKMLANFPKGLFQSKADKCFGIRRMLIDPWQEICTNQLMEYI
jgi:hypothetical protein